MKTMWERKRKNIFLIEENHTLIKFIVSVKKKSTIPDKLILKGYSVQCQCEEK